MSTSGLEVAYGEDKVLSAANVSRADRVKSCVDCVCSSDWILNLVWSRPMTALSNDLDSDNGDCGEEGTFAYSDVTLVEVGNVVETVDLVYTFHASLFDHRQGATRTLFGRL